MLDVKVESRSDNIRIIKFTGDFDLFEQDNVDKLLSDIYQEKPSKIVIDLSEISFMDSTAVGILLAYTSEAEKDGIEIAIVINENAHVERRLGRILQLAEPSMHYFESIEDALRQGDLK